MLGSYSAGADPQLDQAVSLAPLIYSALTQSPHDSSSVDAFAEIAQALKNAK
jgi:flagellum-specific ATP synthase